MCYQASVLAIEKHPEFLTLREELNSLIATNREDFLWISVVHPGE